VSRRFQLENLRSAAWALRAHRIARRDLRRGRVDEVRLPAPPNVPDGALRGVRGALRRTRPTCLERALVLQRWDAAHGRPREVVIGVTQLDSEVVAHAWLEGDSEPGLDDFRELTRILPAG
jgi:Transglutaminase-like superfamily